MAITWLHDMGGEDRRELVKRREWLSQACATPDHRARIGNDLRVRSRYLYFLAPTSLNGGVLDVRVYVEILQVFIFVLVPYIVAEFVVLGGSAG